jgi:hypothetical protein
MNKNLRLNQIVGKFGFPSLIYTLFALIVWIGIHKDYGISWDQSVDMKFGQAVLRYFLEGFDYHHITDYPVENLRYYSPLVPLVSSLLAQISHGDLFSCSAAVTGLFWVATFWPVCLLAQKASGRMAAWLAGLALFCMPPYIGHGFINAKDLPFACAVVWFLLAIASSTQRRHFDWVSALLIGLAFGFVLAVRPGGFFVGALFLIPFLHHGLLATSENTSAISARLRSTLKTGLWLIVSLAVAWAVMIAPWPSAHRSPFLHPLESMQLASKFKEAYPVLFLGQHHQSNQLPWSYFLVYFGVTTPPFLLAAALVGQIRLIKLLFCKNTREIAAGLIFLIGFPLLCFAALRMNVYDGIRHFLFLLPLLAISAGLGGAWLAQSFFPKYQRWQFCGMLVAFASSLPSLWQLHPYQYAYYNFLAGPSESLHRRFETDYWVTSYREAAEWIKQQPTENPGILIAANSFSENAFLHFAPPETRHLSVLGNFKNEPWPNGADYYVGTVRYDQSDNFPNSTICKRIERNGILMSVIRTNHAPTPDPLKP